jgi:hypothetical protein
MLKTAREMIDGTYCELSVEAVIMSFELTELMENVWICERLVSHWH